MSTLSLMQGTVGLLDPPLPAEGPRPRLRHHALGARAHRRGPRVEDAALYQALHRLEAKGWVEAEWGVSENNRRAKYYALTAAGRRQLRAEITSWRRYADAMLKVIDEPA